MATIGFFIGAFIAATVICQLALLAMRKIFPGLAPRAVVAIAYAAAFLVIVALVGALMDIEMSAPYLLCWGLNFGRDLRRPSKVAVDLDRPQNAA